MSMFQAVYFSLAFHLVMYVLISFFPAEPVVFPEAAMTEVEIINKPFDEKKTQQIVRQALAPEKIKLLDDNSEARFLSEQRQRVLLETRARQTGLTQNNNPDKPQRDRMDQPEKNRDHDIAGYEPIQLPKPNEITPEGPSTVGEALPTDVAVGSFTALNTDRFQYYSFYARIEELVRFRWETQVMTAVNSYDPKYLTSYVSRKNWITHIEFLISPTGHLHGSKIMKESGMKPFDQAAILAFKDARIFPNPPKELIESDGYIHLKYAFNVYFEPSAFSAQ